MDIFFIVFTVISIISCIIFATSYICFYMTFYVPRRNRIKKQEYHLPDGKIYIPYHEQMKKWQDEIRYMSHDDVSIKSFDGLTLRGKYFETEKNAPIELMMHGYRSDSLRDLCGGVSRAFALRHNVLLIDQRACGESDGNVISFGINESKDCLSWIDYLTNRFGQEVKIILTGISMGASTALMAIERGLPSCVKGILADCGYSSTKSIIKLVIHKMKLPSELLYPFVKIGAKVFGHFDLEEIVPMEAVKNSPVPIIFAHGDDDRFVPYEMGVQNYNACTSKKLLLTVKGAGHGLCFPFSPDEYINALSDFFSYIV